MSCLHSTKECALSGCFRRLDAEDNGFITRHDVVRPHSGTLVGNSLESVDILFMLTFFATFIVGF